MNQPADDITYQEPPTSKAYPQQSPPAASAYRDSRRKSPLLATVLSIIPGVGQVYVGYYQRGFVHAIVYAVTIAILVSLRGNSPLIPLGGIFLAFFFFYNLVDAWRRASLYNYALEGGTEIDLPDEIYIPGFRGTVVGGVTLVVIGMILLAHTRFGLSLDWVEQWWPAAIIAFGAYLAYKAIAEKATEPREDD